MLRPLANIVWHVKTTYRIYIANKTAQSKNIWVTSGFYLIHVILYGRVICYFRFLFAILLFCETDVGRDIPHKFSKCKFSWRLWLVRPSPLRSSHPIPSKMWRQKFKTRRESLQISNVWSLPESNWKMGAHCLTTIFKKVSDREFHCSAAICWWLHGYKISIFDSILVETFAALD